MTGRITGISGAAVRVTMEGLKLYDRVYAGRAMLTGEVVRLDKGGAVLQIFEDTRGLGIGEPVKSAGAPLTAMLGPGLLSGIFDGLQRPLERMKLETGAFMSGCRDMQALDPDRRWRFFALKKKGDDVKTGEPLGYVEEGAFRHYIMSRRNGRITGICDRDMGPGDSVCMLDDEFETAASSEWPVRTPRPFRKKLRIGEPLITGQRCIDFLFPAARGGVHLLRRDNGGILQGHGLSRAFARRQPVKVGRGPARDILFP